MPDDHTPLEDLLRRRSWEGEAGGELCGDAELLAAYAEGQLPLKMREHLDRHLADCAACQAAVARLVRLAPQASAAGPAAAGPQTARAPGIPLGFRWRWALPTLAGVILVGSFIYYEHSQIVVPRRSTVPARTAKQVAPPAELPTELEAPQAPSAVATARRAQRRKAHTAGEVAGPAATLTTEKDQKRQQPQRELQGSFAARQAAAPAAPALAAPSAEEPAQAERLADFESSVRGTLKKEAQPEAFEEAVGERERALRANAAVANKVAETGAGRPAPLPSPPTESRTRPAAPKSAAKSVLRREDRLSKHAEIAKEKASRPAGAGARRDRSGVVAGAITALQARDARSFGPFRKQISVGARRLALTASGLLLAVPAESNEWQPLAIPSGAQVKDFAVFGEHLWVLLAGGRVARSSNLGRSWDPPVQTPAEDAASIAFTSALSGEIQTSSGRRLRTADGGKSWEPVPR